MTALTGKDISSWQDDVAAGDEEINDKEVVYSTLLKESKENNAGSDNSTAGILLLSMAVTGVAGLMKWKGMV